ncbi:SDR family oxidoreductase [Caldalkalibacillus mannanilyticus]|uniref:SDR family oxidoreductase n=1 Tax=Caldalkalibacillus mannanilyticus TaxID=1418 RepID=UPI0004699749|nr:SDR family oxidoreductase [Caldalkalibacillus mannanilyticus]
MRNKSISSSEDEKGQIKQPIAFVTGTSSGFGLLSSVALAQNGYYVVATMRNVEKKGELMARAKEAGVNHSIEVVQLDVTCFDQAEAVVHAIGEKLGRIDLLLNNAGYGSGGFVEDVPLSDWQQIMDTNVLGLVAVTKAVIPYMREQKKGLIINMSSISGLFGSPVLSPYVSSKFAVEGFSESLRFELLPYGIYTVLVEPGSYQTEIWSKALNTLSSEGKSSAYANEMERMVGHVSEIARQAPPPHEVIELIIKITKKKKPALRYPVGKGVKSFSLLKKILPWSVIERIVMAQLKQIFGRKNV